MALRTGADRETRARFFEERGLVSVLAAMPSAQSESRGAHPERCAGVQLRDISTHTLVVRHTHVLRLVRRTRARQFAK